MRVRPVPPSLIALLDSLPATVHLPPRQVHRAIADSSAGTAADKAVAAAIADSAGFTPLAHHQPNHAVFAERGQELRERLRTTLGPAWSDVYDLAQACATFTPADAVAILRYTRRHLRAQRNALRALDQAPALRTGPSMNATNVAIAALEHNPALTANAITDTQFGYLCDEMAATGRALTISHLVGQNGSGRLTRGHIDALTAAYRVTRADAVA